MVKFRKVSVTPGVAVLVCREGFTTTCIEGFMMNTKDSRGFLLSRNTRDSQRFIRIHRDSSGIHVDSPGIHPDMFSVRIPGIHKDSQGFTKGS